jgi:hypothetical protein
MKKKKLISRNLVLFLLSFSAFFLFTFTACNQTDELSEPVNDDELVLSKNEIESSEIFDEVDDFVFDAMELTDASSEKRLSGEEFQKTASNCPVIIHDSINKIVLLDFGTGCVSADGKTRSGVIKIEYTQRLFHPGASLSYQFINYMVDSISVKGKRILTNISPNYQAPITLNTKLIGGKVIWPDSTFATRTANRTRVWLRAANPVNDEFRVTGTVQGKSRNGVIYQVNIVSVLIHKRKCLAFGVYIPVEGIKYIKRIGLPNILVDFGDGQCDKLITLTVNGQSQVISL